jgi:hypothetical protein
MTSSSTSSVTSTEGESAPAARPRAKGCRIPKDFGLTDERRAKAVAQGLNPELELEKFTNYWGAKAGASATKLDWDLTWNSWCLNGAEFLARDAGRRGRAPSPSPSERDAKEARKLQELKDCRIPWGIPGFRDPLPGESSGVYETKLKIERNQRGGARGTPRFPVDSATPRRAGT